MLITIMLIDMLNASIDTLETIERLVPEHECWYLLLVVFD